MVPESPDELTRRLTATISIGATTEAEERLHPHLLWEIREILKRVKPTDLYPSELLALLAILCPAHARVLRSLNVEPVIGPGGRPILTIVRD